MNRFIAALLIAATPVASFAAPPRPAEDIARDAARKPLDMLVFGHIGKGETVVDFIPGTGYFTRVFAEAVAPGGKVIAMVPATARKLDEKAAAGIDALAADKAYGNITVVEGLSGVAPGSVDVFWTAQNYHDLHNALSPEVVIGFNKGVFDALKSGGTYVVADHAAAAGSGLTATKSLHRIDPAAVKAEVVAAGFVFEGETKALANPADDHLKMVFDPAIRGKTDQFVYRFRKP